jgi:YidC/Oxa1 family membrane protein insertase
MARRTNRWLRVVVPAVVLAGGIGLFIASVRSGAGSKATPAPTAAAPVNAEAAGGGTASAGGGIEGVSPDGGGAGASASRASEPAGRVESSAGAAGPGPAAAGPVDVSTLRARVTEVEPGYAFRPVGSDLGPTPDLIRLDLSLTGGGLRSATLTRIRESVSANAPPLVLPRAQSSAGVRPAIQMTPMAALALEVSTPEGGTPVFVNLAEVEPGRTIWREVSPGVLRAEVVDGSGAVALELERAWRVTPGSYDVRLEQRVTNRSGRTLRLRWYQMGPVDLPAEPETYGGDKRRVRFGYLLKPTLDPGRQTVVSSEYLTPRDSALGEGVYLTDAAGRPVFDDRGEAVLAYGDRVLWPNARSREREHDLVWAGLTSRYFGVAVHPLFDPSVASDKVLRSVSEVGRVVLPGARGREVMGLRLVSPAYDVPDRAALDLSMGLFAGPLSRPVIQRDPLPGAAGLSGLVVYNFGGPCGWCTFDWLTALLLGFLRLLHDHVVFDWSIAIILLVVCVRTLLHPVTKWSQIRMQRFGKQMQELAPKQKKIQEKYAGDRKRMQEETAKLWREEGVNPAGMLGCVPMFLQMPIWIALYATLFFAVELRHAPGFYGLFQSLVPGWAFLADLSTADHFVPLGRSIHVPLLSGLMGPVQGLNVLPLILAVVYFMHTRYLTPPTSTPLTPEQQMQQKMIKWMTVVLFPLIMYNAPSGLSLYFIANSTLAIFENKWIRRHIEKHGLLDLEKIKAARAARGPGFFQRLQAAAEARAKLVEQRRAQQQRGRGGRSR